MLIVFFSMRFHHVFNLKPQPGTLMSFQTVRGFDQPPLGRMNQGLMWSVSKLHKLDLKIFLYFYRVLEGRKISLVSKYTQEKETCKKISLLKWSNKGKFSQAVVFISYPYFLPHSVPHPIQVVDTSEKAMETHSSILAWKIPWMEGPGRLQSMGSLGVGYD